MRLSFGQELRLAQKQVLAPRMIQSMEILQLPVAALQERIEKETEENVTLEVTEQESEAPSDTEEAEVADAPTTAEQEMVVDETSNNEEDFERLLEMDREFPDYFDERPRVSSNRMDEDADRRHDAMANMVARPPTLHEHLREQFGWFDVGPAVKQMAERIIYGLDANGYLNARLEDLIDPNAGDEQFKLAEAALVMIQQLDPPGVGARDLRECLLLQLTPDMPYYEQMRTLISNHLDDLEHNRLPVIERRTGYTIDLIQETLAQLRKLTPKPGAAFQDNQVEFVTPDVFVDQLADGNYRVRLEDRELPSLRISALHRQLLLDPKTNIETKEYIKRKINSAQWLIEAIEQRRNTLTKVAQAIIDHQTDFLNNGPEHIEPLKMQQIADRVGVHVTTVSRAVDGKWVQTPSGNFPLKRFFGGGTVTASGEEVAWDAVRLKLQEVVDNENKSKPLSDDELVKALAKEGFTVARRTVTKYRKAMDIPSSRQRRDWTIKSTPESDAPAPAPETPPSAATEDQATSRDASRDVNDNPANDNGWTHASTPPPATPEPEAPPDVPSDVAPDGHRYFG